VLPGPILRKIEATRMVVDDNNLERTVGRPAHTSKFLRTPSSNRVAFGSNKTGAAHPWHKREFRIRCDGGPYKTGQVVRPHWPSTRHPGLVV